MSAEKPTSLATTQHGGTHYKGMVFEPAEYCQKNKIGFCESSAIKYLSRHASKAGSLDILKAVHFCQMVLEFEYGIKSQFTHEKKEDNVVSGGNN